MLFDDLSFIVYFVWKVMPFSVYEIIVCVSGYLCVFSGIFSGWLCMFLIHGGI